MYLGQHVRLSLQAAIKVLHTHLTGSEAEHFYQEAETIAKLTHPSIVRVFDYDVQDGVPFLVMDYAPGGSLRRRYPKGTAVPLPHILSVVKQVAAGLQYAHDHKFIHRDVKPENMLVGRHGEVLLSDFGLAALAHSSASLSTQEVIGTLPYMAPEQFKGHPRAASDQYALAVTVYEWLCGSRPFEGSATEVMVQQLTMPPPPLHEKWATIPLGIEQVVLKALAKEPKERFASVQDFAQALEQASQLAPSAPMLLTNEPPAPSATAATSYTTRAEAPSPVEGPTEAAPTVELPVGAHELTVFPRPSAPTELTTPQSKATAEAPLPGPLVAPMADAVPSPLEPSVAVQHKTRRLSGSTAALLIGLVVLVLAGGILGSTSLLAHFGVIGARRGATTLTPVRGGTWTDDRYKDPTSLIPNGSSLIFSILFEQALYLPLFYGDAQGVVHPGAATEIPTVQNGGISADFKTWTFHMRPHLVWSDGQPYDARDVDYTWQLWKSPQFGAASTQGYNLISRASVSVDDLSITFHLAQAYAPFVSLWVDGYLAPLPAHHFSAMAPQAILKSPDNLNPTVTSGPFLMGESLPGDHYTLVRNPRYYRAKEGLPYLDKVVFRIVADQDAILQDLEAGTTTSSWFLDVSKVQDYQRLSGYTLVTPPTSSLFEPLVFNFHNTVLASHREVRQAIAMAIDHQALIERALHGFARPLCTDHGSALHPGYEAQPPCPEFNPAAANQLLSDNGWVKGPDGVRTKGGQRLEFEYSTTSDTLLYRHDVEAILQQSLQVIGIKLDIQNYPYSQFWGSFLPAGKASPPSGAVAGRFDIAEYTVDFGYDPDDSFMLACDQFPPSGFNYDFYCNPALDALYRQEQAIADPGLRQQLFMQIHRIYLTEFPFIVLFSPTDFGIVRKGTHNYLPGPLGAAETVNIWQWWCDGGKC